MVARTEAIYDLRTCMYDTLGQRSAELIDCMFRFKSDKFKLVPGSPVGGPFDATEPVIRDGQLTFT